MQTVMLPNAPGERPQLPGQCPICKAPVAVADANAVQYACGAMYAPVPNSLPPKWGGVHHIDTGNSPARKLAIASAVASGNAGGATGSAGGLQQIPPGQFASVQAQQIPPAANTVDATVPGGEVVADPATVNAQGWAVAPGTHFETMRAAIRDTLAYCLQNPPEPGMNIVDWAADEITTMLGTGNVPGKQP